MSDENFPTNVIRMIAAELHFHSAMVAAREMYGKSYFSLGQAEKIAIDQAVNGFVGSNYKDITPEFLAGQEPRQPVGFGTAHGTPQVNPTPDAKDGA